MNSLTLWTSSIVCVEIEHITLWGQDQSPPSGFLLPKNCCT
jgi:hypothetical protein